MKFRIMANIVTISTINNLQNQIVNTVIHGIEKSSENAEKIVKKLLRKENIVNAWIEESFQNLVK